MQIAKIASPQQSNRWQTSSVRQKEHCSSTVVLNKRAVWNVFAVNARIADKSKHKKSQDDTEKKRGALQREVAVLKKARLHIWILSPVWSLSKSWERLDLLFQLAANDRSGHRAPWSPAKILYRERNVNWKRKLRITSSSMQHLQTSSFLPLRIADTARLSCSFPCTFWACLCWLQDPVMLEKNL